MAAGLIALPGAIAVVAILLVTASPSSGQGGGSPGQGAVASAACARRNAPVTSTRTGAGVAVVPSGAKAVLLCRYGPRGGRVRERPITSDATVSRLAHELNALPTASGTYSCPLDDGESVVADFSYPSGPENPVSVGLSGCAEVSNGHVHRIAAGTPVVGRIEALIPWRGTLRGGLEICGGPAPGGCHPTTGITSCGPHGCVHADQVAIQHPIGTQHPNVRLRRGRFTVRVEPGRYRLALLVDGRHAQDRVLQRVTARVRNGQTTRVSFRVSVP